MESARPHRWKRPSLVLPSQTVESGFSGKVLEHVRQRRARPSLLVAKLAAQALLHEGQDGGQLLPQLPSEGTGSEHKQIRPKYLQTALVHQHLTPRAPKVPPRPPSEQPQSARPQSAPEGNQHLARADGPSELEEQGLEIVEAPTSLIVSTETGEAVRIPPHHWLLVDASPSPPSSSSSSSSGPPRQAEVRLSCGGRITQGGSLLRRVPPDRLHAGAAEANFQRASRGTSELALQHAAIALEVLCQCEREVRGVPRSARASALASVAPSLPSVEWTEKPEAAVNAKEEVSLRLHRMQAMVAAQAAMAEMRAAVLPPPEDASHLEAPHELGGRFSKRSVLQRGIEARMEFVEFAQRRFGNTIRAWWKLDQEENLKLGEKLFVRRCVDLGFRGNVNALWRFVDADHSGSVTMLSLDPAAALQLAAFKVFIDSYFDGCPEKVFAAVDGNKSGRLSKQEFVEAVKGKCEGGSHGRLFELIDRRGLGYVVQSDMAYLGRWQPRPYLFTNPDFEGLQRLREALSDTYRSLLKAWRKALDRDGTMRVCWEDFVAACRRVARSPAFKKSGSGHLGTDREIAGVWRALDEDCSGWISLREFDPVSHRTLAEFKRWADSTYKGAVAAFHEIDGNSNGKMQLWELHKASKGPNSYKGDVEALFESLDVNSAGFLTESEFRFLDSWDLEWEEWEAHIRSGTSGKRRPSRRTSGIPSTLARDDRPSVVVADRKTLDVMPQQA